MAKSPFVIEFISDPRPSAVDHSQSSPGPKRGGADRAGYTKATLEPSRLEVSWMQGATALESYVEQALIRFRLKDFVVMVSSDYAKGSCAYTVTLKHEMLAHVDDPKRIFRLFKILMEDSVEYIDLPTKDKPLRAKSLTALDKMQEAATAPVKTAVREIEAQLIERLRLASARHDSADEYKLVYGQCKAADWGAGK